MRHSIVIVGLLVATAASAQTASDESAIIKKSLVRLLLRNRPDIKTPVLVSDMTTPDLSPASPDSPTGGFSAAWTDYSARNAERAVIDSGGLPSNVGLTQLPAAKSGYRYRWEDVARTHPGVHHVVEISRPGFQDGGNVAVIRYDLFSDDGPTTQFAAAWQRTDAGWIIITDHFPASQKAPPR